MSKYLLDTNVISELRKRKPHGAVVAWLQKLTHDQVFVSAVTVGELQVGAERTRSQDQLKADEIETWIESVIQSVTVLAMDEKCFRQWAKFMVRKSTDLVADAMIAATARIHGLAVATRDEADFKQFGVEIFNPFKFK